jgi:NH3-dependent NAD+ synthetase
MNEELGPTIPVDTITKPPSAELRPDQKDSDSLPDYDALDDILFRLVDQHASLQAVIDAGYDPDVVKRIARLLKISEFKRRQAAPGLKVTDRAFGTGWRMPLASREPER